MAHEIILHHYWTSPFSEKIRLVFGLKKLAWRSVEIPNMMPKPDLLPLTGGYRKTPVMQIGADIFCDTQIIIRELERRYPAPSVFPHGKGLPYALAFWADRIFFMPTVGTVFGEIGDSVPEDFKKDRAAMSGGSFSTDALKAMAPFAKDQFRAHARATASRGRSGGVGHLSSMYSRMMVESNSDTSPSISAGTSPRGLAFRNSRSGCPVPIATGILVSYATPFSSSAIFTFCA